jgi:hypothetical protein
MLRLFFGLFLYALGIVVTMNANIGFAPWEVFHKGIANISGFTIGQISIIVGFLICVLVLLMGEKLGLGTLFNMLMIGTFMDMIIFVDFIPHIKRFYFGVPFLFLGLFIIAAATYFYISSGFGAGPRDSLMVAIEKKTGFSSGFSKAIMEAAVVLSGWLLGGPVGLGTVIAAFGIGLCIDLIFNLFNFKPSEVEHETFAKTFNKILDTIK